MNETKNRIQSYISRWLTVVILGFVIGIAFYLADHFLMFYPFGQKTKTLVGALLFGIVFSSIFSLITRRTG